MSDAGGPPYDQRERWDDPEEASRSMLESHQAGVMTAVPVIFKKHDTDKNTVHAQPAIKMKRVGADGKAEWLQAPLLKDVPINYPGGGGASWTFPIKDGDEGIVLFQQRSIDKWWDQGGVQEQVHSRMHDISDGMAIPGFRSKPRKLNNVSTTKAQLRTDDGNTLIEFDPENNGAIRVRSMTNPILFEGDLHVTGEIIGKFGSDNIHLTTHTHAQPNDSDGDQEAETIKPTAGS